MCTCMYVCMYVYIYIYIYIVKSPEVYQLPLFSVCSRLLERSRPKLEKGCQEAALHVPWSAHDPQRHSRAGPKHESSFTTDCMTFACVAKIERRSPVRTPHLRLGLRFVVSVVVQGFGVRTCAAR